MFFKMVSKFSFVLLVSFLFFELFSRFSLATKGVIELDEISWDRVVDGSNPILISFSDRSWKEPEGYAKVSEELKDTEVIVAKVDCNSNPNLKSRFKVESFPSVKFFPKEEKETPVSYGGENKQAEIVEFVRFQLNPKLQELKALARTFVKDNKQDRESAIKKAESIVSQLEGSDKDYGTYYISSMKKIQEKGEDFLTKEQERLNTLINSKSTMEKKKSEFTSRLNILNSFETSEKIIAA